MSAQCFITCATVANNIIAYMTLARRVFLPSFVVFRGVWGKATTCTLVAFFYINIL